MRIALIADTHLPSVIRQLDELGPEIGEFLATVDLILHAGDVTAPGVLDWCEQYAPTRVARGNNDLFEDPRMASRQILDVEGWRIAMTVLGYERGATSLAYPAQNEVYLGDLIAGVRDQGDLDRPDVREKIGRLVVENEVMRANGLRTLADLATGRAPGPESSIEKIFWSEYAKRQSDAALDLLGPQAQLTLRSPRARPDMDWSREYMWSRAGTIYSGTSEIQRNIISKRVLGMPTR